MLVSSCLVSVVAPLHNDSEIVESFVTDVSRVLKSSFTHYEIVLVNDGSNDDTVDKVSMLLTKHECIRLINLSRSYGVDVAIASGLDSVIGDFVVVMLPDMDPPGMIPSLIDRAQKGSHILLGVNDYRSQEPLWSNLGTAVFAWVCVKIFGIPITRNATYFRVLSRPVINAILRVEDKYRYLRLLSFYVGFKSETFSYKPIQRYSIVRRRGLLASVRLAIDMIVANSVRPLRLATCVGTLGIVGNTCYIAYVLIAVLFQDYVGAGAAAFSLLISSSCLAILVILTVLVEYVGSLTGRLRAWTPYYITDEKNSSVLISDPERRNIVTVSEELERKS